MRQRQPSRGPDVFRGHHVPAAPRGQGNRGPGRDQVGAHAVHSERAADGADLAQHGIGQPDPREPGPGHGHLLGERRGVGGEAVREPGGVRLEGEPAADHLGPFGGILARRHLDGQPEPVEQLRTQLAFLRVHGADQEETRRVADRDAFALDVVDAQGRGVEQQVHQVVMEQVDLVDIQDSAVGRGEQAGRERGRTRGQHTLDVERAGQAVLGSAYRQFGQDDVAEFGEHPGRMRSSRTPGVGRGGIARVGTSGDYRHRRQQRGQAADHGRLGGALLAADQDPADGR